MVYVKIIASQTSNVFETQCIFVLHLKRSLHVGTLASHLHYTLSKWAYIRFSPGGPNWRTDCVTIASAERQNYGRCYGLGTNLQIHAARRRRLPATLTDLAAAVRGQRSEWTRTPRREDLRQHYKLMQSTVDHKHGHTYTQTEGGAEQSGRDGDKQTA